MKTSELQFSCNFLEALNVWLVSVHGEKNRFTQVNYILKHNSTNQNMKLLRTLNVQYVTLLGITSHFTVGRECIRVDDIFTICSNTSKLKLMVT